MALVKFCLRDTAGSPERARWLHLARSGSQSQRAIWFILPAHGACHIIRLGYYTAISLSNDAVKTRYPLTSVTRPYRGLMFKDHRDIVFFKVDRWPSTVFRFHRRLMTFVWQPENLKPRLKVKPRMFFSKTNVSRCLWVMDSLRGLMMLARKFSYIDFFLKIFAAENDVHLKKSF